MGRRQRLKRKAAQRLPPIEGPRCAECGGESALVTGEGVYPHRVDLHAKVFWACDCGAYVGCHKDSDCKPLGTPAGPALRRARSMLHDRFDPLWGAAGVSRSGAYAWLASALGIPGKDMHFGLFDIHQCRAAWVALRGITASDIAAALGPKPEGKTHENEDRLQPAPRQPALAGAAPRPSADPDAEAPGADRAEA